MANITRARSPCRLPIGGGFTDLKEYYEKYGGAVIETALGIHTYATIMERKDKVIKVQNDDLNVNERGTLTDLSGIRPFYSAVIRYFSPKAGFELIMNSDVGYGSGLGSSSASLVSIIGAFDRWLGKNLSQYEIAELAHRLERTELDIYAGKQDPYATAFGGFNYIEFSKSGIVVNSMKIDDSILRELQFRTIIADTGVTKTASTTIKDLIQKINAGDATVLEHLAYIKRSANEIKNKIYKGDLDDMHILINEEWEHKRALVEGMSNKQLDDLFKFGLNNGAKAGRLLGSGGGGHMLFIVNEEGRHKLVKALSGRGLKVYSPEFVLGGLCVWRTQGASSGKIR